LTLDSETLTKFHRAIDFYQFCSYYIPIKHRGFSGIMAKRYRVDIDKGTHFMLNEIITHLDLSNLSEAIAVCASSVHDNLKTGELTTLEDLNPTQTKLNRILQILETIEPDLA
jgi:hypothetical protein